MKARQELALAAYRADEGSYPAELSALTPKYLPEIPCDRHNGKALHYVCENDAYRIWGVGENLVDDGGVEELDSGVHLLSSGSDGED